MKQQDKLFITVGTAAVLGTSGFIGYNLFTARDTPMTTTAVQSKTKDTAVPVNNTSSTPASTGYKDGTYTASASYMVPHGQNNIQVSLTLSGGKLSSVSTTDSYSDRESAMYIDSFKSALSAQIVGQPLSDISPSRIGGASDTTKGFNDALDIIRNEAKT